MSYQSVYTLVAVSLLSLTLSACGNVKEQLGIARHSPDEFTVVKRAPLSLPPTYNLRAPSEVGTHKASKMTEQAKQTVFGATTPDVAPANQSAENALLSRIGTKEADPNIRQVLNKENGYLDGDDKSLAERVLFWQEDGGDSTLIDAKEEAKRLQENREKNLPLNTGEVKTQE